MSKRKEERAKHLAGYLSSLSNTLFNVGVFAPIFAFVFNIAEFQMRISFKSLIFLCLTVTFIALTLFFFARKKLNDLPDK
jgi:hypothetical protein